MEIWREREKIASPMNIETLDSLVYFSCTSFTMPQIGFTTTLHKQISEIEKVSLKKRRKCCFTGLFIIQ
jgi:hypothetical protein